MSVISSLLGKISRTTTYTNYLIGDRHLAAGKSAWNYSVDNIQNPFSKVKMYNPENELVRFLTNDERARLLDAASKTHEKLYQMLIVTMSTGLRKRNVVELKRSEVDFETGIIALRPKGDLSHTIVMNQSCRATLESIPSNGSDYFWLTFHGTPYRIDWRKPWEKAKRIAGIVKDFRWHDLRHDAGTRIYTATGDIYATQIFLGHRQATTTKRYAHFLKDKLQATADVLNIVCPQSAPLPSSE
jgi:integrase